MPLTADRDVPFYATEQTIDFPMDANARIFRGAFVGRNRATGMARPLVAGDEFLGVAAIPADNTFPGNISGGTTVRVHQRCDVVLPLAGAQIGDIGKDLYANADDGVTLVPLGNSRIGRISGWESTGQVRVRLTGIHELTGALENLPIVSLADANATLTLDHMGRTLLIANTAARTLTLPPTSSVRAGGWFRVVKTNAAAFAVTLDGHLSETIDGAATFAAVDAAYDVVELLCIGSEWVIVGRDIA